MTDDDGDDTEALLPRLPGPARRPSASPVRGPSDPQREGERASDKRSAVTFIQRARRLLLPSSAVLVLPCLVLLLLGGFSVAPPWINLLLTAASRSSVGLSVLSFSTFSSSPSSSACSAYTVAAPAAAAYHSLFPVPRGRALILVVHATHDATYPDNLSFFIRKAVRCWQDADYVFVIQRDDAASFGPTDFRWKADLPPLPPNARYVLHQNECMDIGSVGWLLGLPPSHPDHVDTSRYRYFFFMNTSVRGPFLPVYLEDHMDVDGALQCPAKAADEADAVAEALREERALFSWFHVFLGKVDERVRMVGCTISCAFATHIQSYVLAMDFVALQLLWQDAGLEAEDIPDPQLRQRFLSHQMGKPGFNESRLLPLAPRPAMRVEADFCRWQRQGGLGPLRNHSQVLACHADFWDTVFNAEIGTSQAVLKAGFSIAALELYWRDVDFRLAPDVCAAMGDKQPPWNHYEDGVPADRLHGFDGRLYHNDPQQVVFTKFKTSKHYRTDDRVKALLAWEELLNRTHLWQATHNASLLNATSPIVYST